MVTFIKFLVLDDSDLPYGAQWDWQGVNYIVSLKINTVSSDSFSVPRMQLIGMLIGDIVVYSLLSICVL